MTRQWAATILAKTNYMFISVTALADAELEKTILDTAMANGTRAFLDAFYARHAATRLPERLSCAAAPPRRLPAWERPPGGLS